MKKVLVLSVFLLTIQAAFAQLSKGDWMVGGSGAASFINQESFKGASFSLAPDGGYFFIDKLAGGIRLKFSTETLKESGMRIAKDNYFSLLPFFRYYILPKAKKINPFGDVAYAIQRHVVEGSTGDKTKEMIHGYELSGGAALFIHSKIALEARLTIDYDKSAKFSTETRALKTNIGFQIHL